MSKSWAQDMRAGEQKLGGVWNNGRHRWERSKFNNYKVCWILWGKMEVPKITYSVKIGFFITSTQRCRSFREVCENQYRVTLILSWEKELLRQQWNIVSLWSLKVLIIPKNKEGVEKRSTTCTASSKNWKIAFHVSIKSKRYVCVYIHTYIHTYAYIF